MFHASVLRHAPWSISKVGMLEKCTQQYQHKYMQRLQEGPKSTESRVGVAGHAVLEHALEAPEGIAVRGLVDHEIESRGLTTQEAQEVVDHVEWMEDYLARVRTFKEEQGVTEHLVEKKVAITPEFAGVDFFSKDSLLRGVIDEGMITKHRMMVVIDHKFGKRKKITEHAVQFNAYRLMAVANYDIVGVQCAINYAGAPRLDWAPPMTREQILRELRPWLATYLNSQAPKLTVIDQDKVQPETGWWCEWCGYSGICSAGKAEIAKRKAARSKRQVSSL